MQFGDTYALQVDCSGHVSESHSPRPINTLESIKNQIEEHLKPQQVTLGQTWFVWGQLADAQDAPETTAEKCYLDLKLISNPDWSKDLRGTGKLLGATVFELWRSPTDLSNADHHILICLFPTSMNLKTIQQQVGEVYFDLMRLFQYRHKIIWTYNQAQQRREVLIQGFGKIRKLAQITSHQTSQQHHIPNLNTLQDNLAEALVILASYAPNLTDLYYQGRTIDINQSNYKKRQDKITNDHANTDLSLTSDFLEFIAPQYRCEIKADHERFERGLTLLQNLIDATRGRIDLYQANRDRRFNGTVAIAGIGLATSQIASAVIVAQQPPDPKTPFFATNAFKLSLATGIVAAILTAIILYLFSRFSRQQ